MNRTRIRLIASSLLVALGLAATGCKSSESTPPAAGGQPAARPVDFDVPTTPQAADKAFPPGDRTPQRLGAVAVRDKRLVAVGYDESFNVSRPLILSSDDGGATWVRRSLDRDSVERSSTFEGAIAVAAGAAGFVVAGSSVDGPVLWHSPDGVDWKRQPTDRKTFPITDEISAITVTTQGFAMVGSSDNRAGDNPNHLVYWHSRDGAVWKRDAGPTIGMKPAAAGSVSATGIVAQGNTIVVSGNLSTPADSEQTDRLQFWYSSDGGRSFLRSTVRGEIATASRVYNNVLATAGGKFAALAQGAGFDDDSWDGVVLEGGTSGSSWRVVAEPWVLGSNYQDSPGTLVRAGNDWVATSQVTTGTQDVIVAAGPSWKQLADHTDTGSQGGRGNQYVAGSVAVDGDAVMVGSTDRSGTSEPAVWRYHGGKVVAMTLPEESSEGRASATVTHLVAAGKDLVAVGEISGAPTGWTRTSSGWQASTLPGRKSGVDLTLTAAAATADGRVVAVGEKQLPIGQRAALWIRAKDGRWSEIDSPTFGVQAKSAFGGPSPSALAIGPRGWVVVGHRHDGDGHDDAWAVYSSDGKSWSAARGDRSLPPVANSDSRRTRRTPWQNLRGPDGGSAEMTTVIAQGTGFVAGGDVNDGSGRAAVWLSPDGVSWPSLVRLPNPSGVDSATVRSFARIGSTLVAVGDISRFDGDPEGGWASWTSTDGGRTWRTGRPAVSARAFAGDLVSVPGGIVGLGNIGRLNTLDAAAWFSRDGRTWRALALPADRSKGAGRQGFTSAILRDGKLLATAFDIPPSGGGCYVLELDLPK